MTKLCEYETKYIDKCLLPFYEKNLGLSRFCDKELKIYEYENAYLLPSKTLLRNPEMYVGGLCDKCGKLYEQAKFLPNRLINSYKFNPEEAFYENQEVIFAGLFWPHWGHFIIEQISRLYYFLEEKQDSRIIVYIGPRPLEGNFLEIFELLGINTKRLVYVDKLTRFKKVYVPEVSAVMLNDDDKSLHGSNEQKSYYTKEFIRIIDKIKSQVEPVQNGYKKVFFSRKDFDKAKSKDFGQIREIETFFEKIGYKIISPETLNVKEQIAILKSAEEFVTIMGTLPHNLLFANKKIKAIILNRSYVITPHQQFIEDITKIRPIYIDAHLSLAPAHLGWGPFFFYISDNLINWAKDNGYQLDRGDVSECFKTFVDSYLELTSEIFHNFKFDLRFRSCFKFYQNRIKGHFLEKFYLCIFCTCPFLFYLKIAEHRLQKLFYVLAYKIKNTFLI